MKKKKGIRFDRIIIVLVLAILIIYGTINQISSKNGEVKVVSKIDDYNYKAESNQTRIYKKYFKELKNEIEDNKIDEEKYVSLLSKLFLIDFYTLSNKVSNQDVGGLQYVYSSYRSNFRVKATDTLYKYVKSNIYGNRHQELPTVKDVSVEEVNQISYSYNDITDSSSYEITARIEYKKDLGYKTNIKLIFIHEDSKLSLVEISEI